MIPLYSAQQVRDADNYAINTLGIPSIVLMENAARSIFEYILAHFEKNLSNKLIGIICGKGNNGGDGFSVARHFINHGYNVITISLGGEEELKGDALTNFRILKNLLAENKDSSITVYESPKDLINLENSNLIIDAMLGTGTRGELSEPYKEIVQKLNQLNAIKIAVDLPTGLDLETATGEIIFNADLTVTLSEFKRGLFYGKGYSNCGIIEKGNIGIGEEYYKKLAIIDYLIEPEDAFLGLPNKELDSHKYSSGRILNIAGSGILPGAAFLSTLTALKGGAGASILAFPESIKSGMQSKLIEPVLLPFNDERTEIFRDVNLNELKEKIEWADLISIGPGLGREEATINGVIELLNSYKNKKMVIDADAIFALGSDRYKKINLKNKILTPHHKEFADLLGISVEEVENNLIEIGKKFASENECYLVLKGAPTIVFNPFMESFINSAGNPGLAKFGSGDVLTGLISAFVAQDTEIEDAIIAAVYIHSLAADLLMEEKTEYGFTASEIMDEIPYAIKFIINSFI